MKTYSELITLPTFEERYDYLKMGGLVGIETFGTSRFLNQDFYTSEVWRKIRDYVINRDKACDLACPGYELNYGITVHHIIPITIEDIEKMSDIILDPEFLITTSHKTHKALHYGDLYYKPTSLITRKPNDTCPWKI